MRSRTGSIASALLAGLLLVGVVAGCGSDDDDSGSAATTSSEASGSGGTTKLTIGYSAWPGWFPLAVADEQGIFEDNGLDVDLKYFTDYTAGFLVMSFIVGGASAAFYGWLPLYLPELFPTRVRATAQGIAFNFGRILAAVGSIALAHMSSGFAKMGAVISAVYVLGMVFIWFAPETKGKPLPE